MDQKQQIIVWLQDAYALEQSLIQVLRRQSAAASHQERMKARLEQHLTETRRHAEIVARQLEWLGAQPSLPKTAGGMLFGAFEGMSTGAFEDQVIKNALADYAMEHFEIGCYSALIAAADEVGWEDLARACSEILREEVAMANWLEDEIPVLAKAHFQPAETAS
jgi:ferritin-like metal-binding protein YciE